MARTPWRRNWRDGHGFVVGVGLDEDAKPPVAVVGRVDESDDTAEGTDRHRRPADELDRGPTFELQPDVIPRRG